MGYWYLKMPQIIICSLTPHKRQEQKPLYYICLKYRYIEYPGKISPLYTITNENIRYWC